METYTEIMKYKDFFPGLTLEERNTDSFKGLFLSCGESGKRVILWGKQIHKNDKNDLYKDLLDYLIITALFKLEKDPVGPDFKQ